VGDGELPNPKLPLVVETHAVPFALSDANMALNLLRAGELTGAAMLVPR
jgi:hypothetical protein